jgi:hypothetical protein
MAILSIVLGSVGTEGVIPRICNINTTDSVAQVTTTGYLNKAVQQGFEFADTDLVAVATKTSPSAAATSVAWYEVVKSGANTSLAAV